MCIIAIIPRGQTISKNDLINMWNTNDDGAGYSTTTTDGKTITRKGFLKFDDFYRSFKKYNTKDLQNIVHFRITSRGSTNRRQTHPFKTNQPVGFKETIINQPVYYMNGTITNLKLIAGLNDTETFLKKYSTVFQFNKPSNKLLDTLEELTSSLWSCQAPDGEIYFSKGFIEQDGKYFSNLNHEFISTYFSDHYITPEDDNTYYDYVSINIKPKDLIRPRLYNSIKSDKRLIKQIRNFIKTHCNLWLCGDCQSCLEEATNKKQIKQIINRK